VAARWVPKPGAPVGNREPIGRRLFAPIKLAGAKDQNDWKDTLLLGHFLEKRHPGEVSLDRLGERQVDNKVRSFLTPRCHDAACTQTPPKRFAGWAWIVVEKLINPSKGATGFAPIESAIAPSAPGASDDNPYHAHVCRRATAYDTAASLRQIFHDDGDVFWVDKKSWWWIIRSWIALKLAWFKSAFSHWF
jgi:hypothetical protein